MSAPALRPRSAIEIIDAAFRLYRQRWAMLVATVAVAMSPVLLLHLFVRHTSPDVTLLTLALQNVLVVIADGAVIVIVADVYTGAEAGIAKALGTAFRCGGRLFMASLLRGVVVGIGFILLIVPGLIAFARTIAMPMAIVIENERSGTAMGRSGELTRGSTWRILGTMTIGAIIFLVVLFAADFAVGMILAAVGGVAFINVITDLTFYLVYPFVSVTMALLYFDLRIRTEGFDLEQMFAELEGRPAAVPTPAATA